MLLLFSVSCKDNDKPKIQNPVLPEGWTELAPMPETRTKHAVVLLADGRVLICGGEVVENGQVVPTRTSRIYDPVSNSWTETGAMNVYRVFHSIMRLDNGKILVWGGYNSKAGGQYYLNDGEVFDPATGQWNAVPKIPAPEMGPWPAIVKWSNGEVTIGGKASNLRYHPGNSTVTPDSGVWHSVLNGIGVSICRIHDSAYLLWGGNSGQGSTYSRFVLNNKVFDTLSFGKHSRSSGIALPGNRILVLGGLSSLCEIYDFQLHAWTAISRPDPVIGPGNVALFEGHSGNIIVVGSMGLAKLDINSLNWTTLKSPADITWGDGCRVPAVKLTNGKIFICGGVKQNTTPAVLVNNTFSFEP